METPALTPDVSSSDPDESDKSRLGRMLLHAASLETARLDTFLERLAVDTPALASEIRRRVSVPENDADTFLAMPAVYRLGPPSAVSARPPDVTPPVDFETTPISERYELGRCLGEGGMARVFEAVDHKLSRRLALKFLTQNEPHTASHFLREARAQAQIRHRHVLEVYDTGELDGCPFIAMRLVAGATLREMAPNLTLEARVRLVAQAAEGLQAAHRQGLVHRDVKPSNILVEESAEIGLEAFIADFGIAGRIEGADTDGGALSGTLAYMAPERLSPGRGPLDRRSDIYSLGVTLYQVLCGHMPFGTADPAALIYRILHQDPVPLRQHVPDLPVELEAIVTCCMARHPDDRYTSARAVAADLQRYLAGEIVEAYTASVAYRLTRFAQRHRVLVGMAATSLIAIVVASVLITIFAVRSEHERQRAELRRQQAEALIDFMVVDLRDKLSSTQRLEVLEEVHDSAMAYFAAVPAAELTDEELAKRSRALYQIGEVRIQSGDIAGAVAPLDESLALAQQLSERAPADAKRRFDLGQSYFWVGFVHFKRSHPEMALEPFRAYLEIAEWLTALDAENFDWRRELSFAHSNLGSVLEDLGDFEGALEHFRQTLAIDQQLVAARPQDLELQAALGSTHNTLGEALQKLGYLSAAQAQFEADLAIDRRLAAAEPDHHRHRSSLATSLDFLASLLLVRGELEAARKLLEEAGHINRDLVARDPQNAVWQKKLAWSHLRLAEAHLASGCLDPAFRSLDAAQALLDHGLESNVSHQGWLHVRSVAAYLRSRVWFERDPHAAEPHLRTALEMVKGQPAAYAANLLHGKMSLLAGWIEARQGHQQRALTAWNQAYRSLEPLARGSRNGRMLAPWAEVLFALRQTSAAGEVLAVLRDQEFVAADFIVLCRRSESQLPECPALISPASPSPCP